MMHININVNVAVIVFALVSCAEVKTKLAPPREPFESAPYVTPVMIQSASLYQPGKGGLFEDHKAHQVGDILVIRIDESNSAAHGATTDLSRKGNLSAGAPSSLGILPALQAKLPNVDPATLLAIESASGFNGAGNVKRSGSLNGTLPVQVRQVMPNGDLLIEGQKRITVGNEQHSLYIRGLVRVGDILPDNTVLSSRIAAAEIEYTGDGDVSSQQRPGWLSRGLTKIWPF